MRRKGWGLISVVVCESVVLPMVGLILVWYRVEHLWSKMMEGKKLRSRRVIQDVRNRKNRKNKSSFYVLGVLMET